MILRTTLRFGILLFACAALSACNWPGSDNNVDASANPSAVVPANGTAIFKTVDINLRKATATFEGRDVIMYWDDQTIFVRNGKATRVSSKYWVAEMPVPHAPAAGTMPSPPPKGQYFKESKVMSDIEPPKAGDVFDFRGFKTHGQIALRVISFK